MSEKNPHEWFQRGMKGEKPASPKPPPADELDENAPIEIDLEALAAAEAVSEAEEAAEEPQLPEGAPRYLSDEGPPADAQPLPGEAVTKAQLDGLADRLEDLITEYCRHGVRIGVSLSSTRILEILDRVLTAAGGEVHPSLTEGSAEDFFAEGLYEELIDQPANIFDPVKYSDGNTYWVPISGEVWRDSVSRLRSRIQDEGES